MPISEDEFRTIDEDTPVIDLAPDTTQGKIYRFLLVNADKAFRQREIVDAVDVPRGSVGPTLKRLERRGLVDHRGRYWKIADAEHATASAGLLGAATVDEIDGGFSNEEVDEWMETAVDPIDELDEDDSEGA
ncbi:winged helix-turn-helix domain-containing protein [Salinilacihabitans rarus]|uniref:winged helix-turn-helix domain-containing protein n=1 Tax=Salinilacihabitans rarus TaxID=2961596 RepID=UPI0020C8E2F2|nr:winged helix-turn-helix domain-containing protein [Salinilacihabitans rarus]